MVNNYLSYRNSARALVEQLSFFAPASAEKLKEVVDNFDVDKLKQVVQIADKTGMNNGQQWLIDKTLLLYINSKVFFYCFYLREKEVLGHGSKE